MRGLNLKFMAQEETKKSLREGTDIELSDGRKVHVAYGTGHDSLKAQSFCDGDTSKMQSYLMALLVTIDGEKVKMEDLLDLGIKDFLSIQAAFAQVNFM